MVLIVWVFLAHLPAARSKLMCCFDSKLSNVAAFTQVIIGTRRWLFLSCTHEHVLTIMHLDDHAILDPSNHRQNYQGAQEACASLWLKGVMVNIFLHMDDSVVPPLPGQNVLSQQQLHT